MNQYCCLNLKDRMLRLLDIFNNSISYQVGLIGQFSLSLNNNLTCFFIYPLALHYQRKTGGMVVWRAGWKIVLYRGPNYKYPYFLCDEKSAYDHQDDTLPDSDSKDEDPDNLNHSSSRINGVKSDGSIPPTEIAQAKLMQGVGLPNRVRFQLPAEAQLAEEAEDLLVGLGPRFTDWWGYDPLPVDADLLPAVVSGYRRPFRLLPYGVNPKLTNDEMTILRRLGRPLPCHFALGEFATYAINLVIWWYRLLVCLLFGQVEIGIFKDWLLLLSSSGKSVKLPKLLLKEGCRTLIAS